MILWPIMLTFATLTGGQDAGALEITGRIPSSLGSAVQMEWISADSHGTATCERAASDLWTCRV